MTKARFAIPLLLLLAASAAAQQRHRDPLSDLEIDKLRDAAQLPDVRLKLYVDFARARLDKLQQIRADTKAPDREQQTRDALQDFLDLYDELDTNVDTFADRRDDLRKALKPVIEADTEFGSKLRVFKSSVVSNAKEAESYAFLLEARSRQWIPPPRTTVTCWQSRKKPSGIRRSKSTRLNPGLRSEAVVLVCFSGAYKRHQIVRG